MDGGFSGYGEGVSLEPLGAPSHIHMASPASQPAIFSTYLDSFIWKMVK